MWGVWTYSYELKSMPKTVNSASGGAWQWWNGACRRAPPQALPHARQRPRVSAVLHEGCHRLHCIVHHLTQQALHGQLRSSRRCGSALQGAGEPRQAAGAAEGGGQGAAGPPAARQRRQGLVHAAQVLQHQHAARVLCAQGDTGDSMPSMAKSPAYCCNVSILPPVLALAMKYATLVCAICASHLFRDNCIDRKP